MDAILQTLAGGLLALAGAIIGPFFQRRHDRWVAQQQANQLLRDKAQELFDEIDRLIRDAGQASIRAIQKIKDDNAEPLPVPDLGRIRSISAIYFPSCLELIQTFEAKHSESVRTSVRMVVEESKKNYPASDVYKMIPVMMVTEFQTLSTDLCKEIRDRIASEVPATLKLGG